MWPLLARDEATGVTQQMRVRLKAKLGSLSNRARPFAQTPVVNGAPRSEVNTKADYSSKLEKVPDFV
jgi:hypothetical protein